MHPSDSGYRPSLRLKRFFGPLSLFMVVSCGFSGETASEQTLDGLMEAGLVAAVAEAHYVALIQNSQAIAEPLPDTDPSDDYQLVRWSFQARVLETFRGPQMADLAYTVDLPAGEEANLGEEPFIIMLCIQDGKYHWPGIGFNFPATPATQNLARQSAQRPVSDLPPAEDCGY